MQTNSNKTIVWSQSNCPACSQAKALLDSRGITYEVNYLYNNVLYTGNGNTSNNKKPRGSRYRGVSRNGNQWQVKKFSFNKKSAAIATLDP